MSTPDHCSKCTRMLPAHQAAVSCTRVTCIRGGWCDFVSSEPKPPPAPPLVHGEFAAVVNAGSALLQAVGAVRQLARHNSCSCYACADARRRSEGLL